MHGLKIINDTFICTDRPAKRTQRLSWPSIANDVIWTSELGSMMRLVIRQSVGLEPITQVLANIPVDVVRQAFELTILTTVLKDTHTSFNEQYTTTLKMYRYILQCARIWGKVVSTGWGSHPVSPALVLPLPTCQANFWDRSDIEYSLSITYKRTLEVL